MAEFVFGKQVNKSCDKQL